MKVASVNQMSHHESVCVLIRRAVQRGMAISQIKRNCEQNGWKPSNEKIIQEVIKLGSITLPKPQFEELCKVFEDTSKNVQFIFSNEEEFAKIQKFCEQIQDYIRSPIQITASKSVVKKIGIGVATVVGGALLAYAAGPGLVVIGVMEAVSMSAAGMAGAVGGLSVGFATNKLLTDKLVDENYEQVLNWITQELYKKLEKTEQLTAAIKDDLLQEVSDLREDGKTFNQEKALLLMYNSEIGVQNFVGSDLENCNEESKISVIKRIECIKTIHNIRNILAKQCYIGVVGIQDAGKTTLLRKLWGIGGATGQFQHTDVPSIYELHRRMLVIDFPGSNSLDYHAKTFSICGAMNNFIIIVIPYTGDINTLISKEISKVFSVMAGSESTHILLCINKCGYELPKAIREELPLVVSEDEEPIDYLRSRFAAKLNDYYESTGASFTVPKENILFTDWLAAEDEGVKSCGIVGVDAVKGEIKKYLEKHSILEPCELQELSF